MLLHALFTMSSLESIMKNLLTSYEVGNATDVGLVRKVNEDYYGAIKTLNGDIVLVCDGMGGHAGGETASRLAVEAIAAFLNVRIYPEPLQALSDSIVHANRVILDYAAEHPELKGMGSTCVALLVTNDCCYYGHVGDSRIYLYSRNRLQQMTRDHSFVQSLVDAGAISRKDAEHHPRKNEVTNVLGLERMELPTLCKEPCNPRQGDIMLLCSDGLTGMVSDDNIVEVLRMELSLYNKAKELVKLANQAGGLDNITVQLVQFNGAEEQSDTISLNKQMVQVVGAILVLCAVVFMAFGSGIGKKVSALFHGGSAAVTPPVTVPATKAMTPASGGKSVKGGKSVAPDSGKGKRAVTPGRPDGAKKRPVTPAASNKVVKKPAQPNPATMQTDRKSDVPDSSKRVDPKKSNSSPSGGSKGASGEALPQNKENPDGAAPDAVSKKKEQAPSNAAEGNRHSKKL